MHGGLFVRRRPRRSRRSLPYELLDERNFAQSLFGTCPFQFLVASDKLDQAKVSFKVKVPPDAKHSSLSDLAKRAVDPASKAASLAVFS